MTELVKRLTDVLDAVKHYMHLEGLKPGNSAEIQLSHAYDIAREISAALSTPEGEWRPIETAPKDGTAVLGFQATPGDHENRMAVCWRYGKPETPLWMGEGGLMPTHWMPLPKPPASPLSKENEHG